MAAVLGAAALAACGSPDTKSRESGGSVSIKHRFGATEIKGTPKRVVALDTQWTDVLLAMGVKPVGHAADAKMGPGGRAPWQTGLPASSRSFTLDIKGPPLEQVAAMHPDLIVGTYTITDRTMYDKLSDIAPTVASVDDRQVERWQDLVGVAGKIFHDPAKAKRIVDGVNGKVAAIRKQMPWLNGKTFALAQYMVGDSVIAVADPSDGSSVLFTSLGMRQYPRLVAEGKRQKSARIQVSPERLDVLRSDLLLFLINGGTKANLKDLPGWNDLPSVRDGSAAVLDYPTIAGLNIPTPLSIPAALDKVTPALRALK
ncbi:MAG TPA: ABC transporter substrate-binding protein [Streptosporangiaceae bacterium]